MKTIIKKGNDMTFKERRTVYLLQEDIFNPCASHKPISKTDFLDNIYFMIKDKNKLLSVGMLEPVWVKFKGKNYKLWGAGGAVSAIRGKGYGKMMMTAMWKYAKEHDWTLVGFCSRYNTPFYVKCGLNIAKDQTKRFVHKQKDGTLEKNIRDQDVVYFDGRNQFMKRFLSNKKNIVWIPYSHW
jgi:hypothetical protein